MLVASQLSGGGPLMWIMPKHLHFNKKKTDGDDVSSLARGLNFCLSLFIFVQTLSKQAVKSRWPVCAFVKTYLSHCCLTMQKIPKSQVLARIFF